MFLNQPDPPPDDLEEKVKRNLDEEWEKRKNK